MQVDCIIKIQCSQISASGGDISDSLCADSQYSIDRTLDSDSHYDKTYNKKSS